MKNFFVLLLVTSVFLFGLLTGDQVQGQVIANSSLTGPPTVSVAPPSWFEWQKTPDTVDASGPFNNTGVPWVLSPDGGTFVRAGGSTFVNSEAIGQVVSGFTPGASYNVTFFQTNLGFEHPSTGAWNGEDGYWELVIDGVSSDTASVLTKPTTSTDPIVWSSDSMSFIAPGATVEIALVSRSVLASGLAAYMGIDNVQVHGSVIPEPSSLVSAGILLLLGAIHRRPGRMRR